MRHKRHAYHTLATPDLCHQLKQLLRRFKTDWFLHQINLIKQLFEKRQTKEKIPTQYYNFYKIKIMFSMTIL